MLSFGLAIAPRFLKGDIVKITGPLGAGKTTLVRGIVAGLGGNPSAVHSPTFSFVHQYQECVIQVFHCDFYRLPNESEMEEFGGAEFFAEDLLYLVEWPEKIKPIISNIPNRLLGIDLRVDSDCRIVTLSGTW